jgi:hypothetical protein
MKTPPEEVSLAGPPRHEALEELLRLFEPSIRVMEPPHDFRRLDSVLGRILSPRLPRREAKRARRWHAYMSRLHRARQDCAHPAPLRVLWADWTVTAVCPDCGQQGWPMRVPKIGQTLVIPRDLKELLALTGLRSLEPTFADP